MRTLFGSAAYGRVIWAAGMLGLLAGLSGAQQVPAVVNVYRANPLQPAALSGLPASASTSVVSAERVRELYFQASIAGPMQGDALSAGSASGTNSAGTAYPTLVQSASAKDRLPSMTVVRTAGADGVYGTSDDRLSLFVTITKLPLRSASNRVLANMAALGLLPPITGGTTDAVATGNWRMLVHPPRGKGAPPAPCLYYPEAIGALKPADAAPDTALPAASTDASVYQEFWGADAKSGKNPLVFRYRDWDKWIRNVWTTAGGPVAQSMLFDATGKIPLNGIIPMPWFLASPDFATKGETGVGNDLTNMTDAVLLLADEFFNPDTVWENRRFDPDGTVPDSTVDLSTSANFIKRKPPELAPVNNALRDKPIEVRFCPFADSTAPVPPADPKWCLPGLSSVGAVASPTIAAGVDHSAVTPTTVGDYGVISNLAQALTIEVDLLSGCYRAPGQIGWYDPTAPADPPTLVPEASIVARRPVLPGVGMVEFQFEYETAVPVINKDGDANYTAWRGTSTGGGLWPFGTNGALDGTPAIDDDITIQAAATPGSLWDLTIGAGTRPAVPLSLLQAHAPRTMTVGDSRSAAMTLARNPIDIKPAEQAAGHEWRLRRYSPWPYNPTVTSAPTAGGYFGGPIVCRYMVSGINVVPQDANIAATTGYVRTLASYNGTNQRYPQFRVTSAAAVAGTTQARDITADLERANFLIGYQPDGGTLSSNVDYFFPISPGAKSSVQSIFVQAVESLMPGGQSSLWTEKDYALTGPADVATGWSDTATTYFNGYKYGAFDPSATAGNEAQMLYFYDLEQNKTGQPVVADPLNNGVATGDTTTYLNVADAFDGNPATNVTVPKDRHLGRMFDLPAMLDRIELVTDGAAKPVTDYQVETYNPATNAWGVVAWGWNTLAANRFYIDPPHNYLYGVRLLNTAAPDGKVAELRLITHASLNSEVSRPPTEPNTPSDTEITAVPVSGSAIHLSNAPNRLISVNDDSLTQLDLLLQVPRYQPPSRDAVERQILSETNQSPTSWVTRVTPSAPNIADWDRYRGTVRVFADDQSTLTNDATDAGPASTPLRSQSFDASLYRLANGGATQFVRWYDELGGTVAGAQLGGAGPYLAPLDAAATGAQHVAIESYAPFDVEFSVGYERRMSIAEKFLDFGKAVHGGVSQWVPVTLTNEGNVPLRKVKLYVEAPMSAVQLADTASAARRAQSNPIPSWFFQDLALSTAGEGGGAQLSDASSTLDKIWPADPGSPSGRTVTNVYLRVGRNDLGSPVQRIPVGQPMGNYTGQLRAFVDDLAAPGNDVPGNTDLNNKPDPLTNEVTVGGSAVTKITVQESPFAPITDFWDNETSRNPESGALANTAPYNPLTGTGTYQPVPVFGFANYSHPDVADATPTIAVQQDLTQMNGAPPNNGDKLTLMWSRFLNGGGGTPSWDVWFQQAARPNLATVLSSNYRSFVWPSPGRTSPVNAPVAGERNLYPNVCPVPGTNPAQYVLLWHNEANDTAQSRRSSSLRLARYDTASGNSGVISLADDQSNNGLVNKQVPRAFVSDVPGAGSVLWTAWQSGASGKTNLGFNAITLPTSVSATTGYTDAVAAAAGNSAAIGNYDLRTPPGLTNIADPWVLPSYRNEVTNVDPGQADPRTGNMRLLNAFYSAWSPVWQNQDIYWTRYRAVQDPTESAAGDNVANWKDGLANSPMVENAFRLVAADTPGPVRVDFPAAGTTMTLTSLPGGRVPFPRFTNDPMQSTPEHVVYVSSQPDWVMPGAAPTFSYCDPATPGTRQVVKVNHRGFADTVLPITDRDAANAAVPLVQLRLFAATTATQPAPNLNATPAPALLDVTFDLPNSLWDDAAEEWVVPLDGGSPGGAVLATRGVTAVRMHPGLGRMTFNAPVWKLGSNNPIYLYVSYRPGSWRMTSDPAVDSQPTASFDWWERLVLVWRRGLENGRGQLWYRTYSLGVPLLKPPLTALDSVTDLDTAQAVPITPSAAELRDGMLNLPSTYAGHRLQVAYRYTYQASANSTALGYVGSNGIDPEDVLVPGSGPERLVPMDGLGSESMPSLAVEHYFAGYPFTNGGGTINQNILSGRFWLAWVSTRDLYKPNGTGNQPPLRGTAAAHVYYGTFMPDFAASAEAR